MTVERFKALGRPGYRGFLFECVLASDYDALNAELAWLRSIRIIEGKGGRGYAYVIGDAYPVEGVDGIRFHTPQMALDAARKGRV